MVATPGFALLELKESIRLTIAHPLRILVLCHSHHAESIWNDGSLW